MICFKKDPGLRKGATELLKHPWLTKTEISKTIKPKIETPKPVLKKEEPKKEEAPKKIELKKDLSKFSEDNEWETPSPIKKEEKVVLKDSPVKKTGILSKFSEDSDDSPIPKKNNSISKWTEEEDEKSSTIVKGDDIAKKLKEMKITPSQSVPIVKKKIDLSKFKDSEEEPKKIQAPNSPGTPILVREAKNKDLKKWSEMKEEDDDQIFKKPPKKIEIKKQADDFDEVSFGEDFLKDQFEKNGINVDKHFEEELKQIISTIQKESPKEDIQSNCEKLLKISEDPQHKKNFDTLVGQTCLIPIIEVLSYFEEDEILLPILKLLKVITKDSVPNQETLALIGAFPKIMKFSSYRYSKQVREESNLLIYYLCMETKSSNGVQMFIASAGLPILSQFLKHSPKDIENDEKTREIIIRTVKLILYIINLTVGRNHKRDFCRLFSESDLIKELCNIINGIDRFEKNFWTDIFTIFHIFSTNGDSVVKQHLKKGETLKSLYLVVAKTTPEQKLLLYNTLKNLTIEPSTDHEFTGAGLLKVMVKEFSSLLIDKNIHQSQSLIQKIYFQVVNIFINICVGRVVEKKEQENNIIAEEGIIPLLIDAIKKKLPLHDCNLRLLSKLATGSQIAKSKFLESGGIEFFFECLSNSLFTNYQAMILDKLHLMLYNNSNIVEPILLKNTKVIASCFIEKKIELLEPFAKIISASKKSSSSFTTYKSLISTLQDWLLKFEDPNVLMKLLKILTNLFQNAENKEAFWTKEFQNTLDKLLKKGTHMVKKLVSDLIKTKENYF